MGHGFDDDSSAGGSSRSTSSRKRKPSIFSKKSLPSNGKARPNSWNDKARQEALQRQAQLYAELAKELEEKLTKRNAEIMALRRSNQVLQKECTSHKSKISTLETQCVARSAKVAQLSDTIAARKSGKVQQRLVEKSLEIADLVEENERLKIQKKTLQEEKSRNDKLLLEMCEIVKMLNQIDVPYDKAGDEGCYSNMIHPKGKFSTAASEDLPQDIPMENVRRKIQAIEGTIRQKEELQKENDLQKHKLEVLREKNADLNLEISNLETKLKDHKGPQGWVHTHQQRTMSGTSNSTWGNDSQRSRATFSTSSFSEDGSKEVSLGDFVAENGRTSSEDPSEDTGIHDSIAETYGDSEAREFLFSPVDRSLSTVDELNGDSDGDDSDNTSFSSLESPPSQDLDEQSKKSSVTRRSVRLEEHKQLQNNFEKALDVIEKLKEDLGRATKIESRDDSYKRDVEELSKEVQRLEDQLEESVNQHTLLKGEHKALCDRHEEEMEASKRMRDNLEATHKEKLASLDQTTKAEVEDLRKQNKNLQKQYNDLETEYSLKIEALELKLKEMKHQFKLRRDDSASKCENLEDELAKLQQKMKKLQEEYDAIDSVHQQRVDILLEEHDKNVVEEKKKFDDLRYEYDTFLEIHLKLEEDAEQAKQYYKDSLLKIRGLESEANANKEAAEKTKEDHQKAIEEAKIAHQQATDQARILHQEEVTKLEATVVEWKNKLMKLKRDHVSAVKAHNEATQKFIAEIKQIKKEHGVVMAKQGRLRQNDAAKYQKLRREYDSSLVDYGKREQITVHKYEQSKRAYESKLQNCHKKIREFEKILPLSKKNAMKAKFDNIESESRKKIDELQLELLETSRRLEAEANERLAKVQTRSNEKLERLMQANQKLNEHSTKCEQELEKCRRCQEQVMFDYQDLVASYQASLLKIEYLIQNREEKQSQRSSLGETKKLIEDSGGTVMEQNKEREQKSDQNFRESESEKTVLEIPPPTEAIAEKRVSQSSSDSGFQKDFEMIVSKLGVDSSHGENLEASSVVSGAGSSVAGSAVFEAIYRRVEEHAQKLEITKTMESTVAQTLTTQVFEVAHIFDVLHHFVQLREVNSCFIKLPRFQTQNGENEIVNGLVSNLGESRNTNETISNLLVHRKRFQSVQSSLMRQIRMMQLDELHPSTLIGLFPSEYGHSSIEENEDESSSSKLQQESFEEARIQRQLNLSAQEIRSKTREKEMRLLNLKYQNLRDEFQEIKSAKINQLPSNIAVRIEQEADDASSHGPSIGMSSVTTPEEPEMKKIESFQKKVLQAELKAALSKREWEQQKKQLDLARFEHEVTMASLLNDTEDVEKSSEKVLLTDEVLLQENLDIDPNEDENLSSEEEPPVESHKELDVANNEKTIKFADEDQFSSDETTLSPTYTSYDSEDSTSNGESRQVSTASLEAQDGKPASSGSITKGTKETAEETDFTTEGEEDADYDDCSGDSHDVEFEEYTVDESSDSEQSTEGQPKKKFDEIQLELEQAKSAAEAARRKQLEREQNLRDVIFHYKTLQKQHQEAVNEKSRSSRWKKSKPETTSNLENDLRNAHENVNAMKKELKEASEQHSEEKEHLRHVMSQFQNLQVDFLKILAEKQELEKAVSGMASGVVPASISIGPQPRFFDSSGSWVASTIGGVSFETESSKARSYRPAPDGSPLRKVPGPPQRSNNQTVSSCKIVELCDRDRVFRPQVHQNQALTPPKLLQSVESTQNSDHTTRTSSATTHSSAALANPREKLLRPDSRLQQQQPQLNSKQVQQQKHAAKLRQLSQKHMHSEGEPTAALPKSSTSKKKKGIFRGWRKQ